MGTTEKYNEKLNILGSVLKKYRLKKNMSLGKISDELSVLGINMSSTAIYKIENNERCIKDFELIGLSIVLGFPLEKELKHIQAKFQKNIEL